MSYQLNTTGLTDEQVSAKRSENILRFLEDTKTDEIPNGVPQSLPAIRSALAVGSAEALRLCNDLINSASVVKNASGLYLLQSVETAKSRIVAFVTAKTSATVPQITSYMQCGGEVIATLLATLVNEEELDVSNGVYTIHV